MIRASIYGRLGADPQERTTRNGGVMATASLAVSVGRPDADEDTEWFDLVTFGRTAKALLGHAKGDLVAAMGPLHRTRFTDRDGEEREGWSLTVEAIVSARTVRPTGGGKRDRKQEPSTSAPQAAQPTDDDPDDDIPF